MRLIDADEFKKQIAAAIIRNNLVAEKGNAMCNLIDKQPTAYDVDKVVEGFERVSILEDKVLYASPDEFGKFIKFKDAVKIVESGGIE